MIPQGVCIRPPLAVSKSHNQMAKVFKLLRFYHVDIFVSSFFALLSFIET